MFVSLPSLETEVKGHFFCDLCIFNDASLSNFLNSASHEGVIFEQTLTPILEIFQQVSPYFSVRSIE